MKTMNFKHSQWLIALMFIALFTACEKKNNTNPDPEETGPKYSALLMVGAWPNTAYYIVPFNSLTEGNINLAGNGAEISSEVYAQDILQKNGFFYHANFGSGQLGKYHIENGALITDKKVPFTQVNWSSFDWINDKTLAVFGTNGDQDEVMYAIINTETMKIESVGGLEVKPLPTGYTRYNIGFAEYRDGKVFLNYSFGGSWDNWPTMPIYGKAYVAVVDYATKKVESNLESDKLKEIAGPTVYAPTSFQDESGDIYFLTQPAYNYDYNSPSSIFRIKKGATAIDNSYFFDHSAVSSKGQGAAMWYVGNGKAIVRTTIEGTSIDAEHNFYVVNVHTGKLVKKLDLPADNGERMVQAVIVEDGKAYIAVNSTEKDYIWEYDPSNDSVKKGAEIIGGVDYILRIEKLR
jgi:hypothetical protein